MREIAADRIERAPEPAQQRIGRRVDGPVRRLPRRTQDDRVARRRVAVDGRAVEGAVRGPAQQGLQRRGGDRKSTRLLQSLMRISSAVFCLKKKKLKTMTVRYERIN